jgi:hypothetical protein
MIIEIIQRMTNIDWIIFVVTIIAYLFLITDIWLYNGISQSFFTWFLWGILDTILFITTYQENGTDLAILLGCVIGSFCVSIFLFIIKKRKWTEEESLILSLIIVTIIVWLLSRFISGENTIGIISAVIAEMLAGIPLMKASWKKPGSRYTLVSYLFFITSYVISLINTEVWEIKNFLFPLAFLIYGIGDTSPLIRKWWRIMIRYKRISKFKK